MLLGDMVAGVTRLFGIQGCEACARRQQALNAWHAALSGQSQQLARRQPFVIEAKDGQLVDRGR